MDRLMKALAKASIALDRPAVSAQLKDLGIAESDLNDQLIAEMVDYFSKRRAQTQTVDVKAIPAAPVDLPVESTTTDAQTAFAGLQATGQAIGARLAAKVQAKVQQKISAAEETVAEKLADRMVAEQLKAMEQAADFYIGTLGSVEYLLSSVPEYSQRQLKSAAVE